MERGKKGLSAIIATLIIILLVLVAVAIVWTVLKNVIRDSTEQVNLGKFTLDLDLKQMQVLDSNTISVTVKRNPGQGEFISLNFIIEDGDNSEVVKVNGSMGELEQRVFTVNLQTINSGNITKISIAPVFRLESGKEIIGDIKDSLEFQAAPSSSPECTLASQCNDGNVCTTDTCPSGTCVNTAITSCTDGDGCCPSSCTISNDDDCSASCGDSTCDVGECNTCAQDCTHAQCCGDSNCNNGEICGVDDVEPACNSDCGTCAAVCGNSIVEGTEQCDGSNLNGNSCATVMGAGYTGSLGCYAAGLPNECTFYTSECVPFQPTSITIFVTSTTYISGNLGGLAGADLQCQALADAAGLTGTWMAWMSDCQGGDGCPSGTSASDRLTHLTSDYVLPNGVVVANGWGDLTDGDLDNPINIDENGNTVARIRVNTGTNATGFAFLGPFNDPADPGRYCVNWVSTAGWAYAGYTDEYEDDHWTTQNNTGTGCDRAGCGGGGCTTTTPFKIYCLRQ